MLTKKTKVDAECHSLNKKDKWTNGYLFVEVKGKTMCLKHVKLDVLKGQAYVDKVAALQQSLRP